MPLEPHVQDELIARVKAQILDGRLGQGSRLPSRRELCRRFGVSSVTLQKAVDRLVADDFLVTQERQGTYVADRLPHLQTLGLVLPCAQHELEDRPYMQRLVASCRQQSEEGPWIYRVYWNVDWHRAGNEAEVLREDIAAHRIGGVIYGQPPSSLYDRGWWRALRLPQLTLSGVVQAEPIPVLATDMLSFLEQSCEVLRRRGCRRVAVIGRLARLPITEPMATVISRHGLEHAPAWQQTVAPDGAGQCLNLLFSPRMRERPDGLIVTDDSLLPAVADFLAAVPGGGSAPAVVCLANFPTADDAPPGVTRVGFDIAAYLRQAGQQVGAAIHGEAMDGLSRFGACEPAAFFAGGLA